MKKLGRLLVFCLKGVFAWWGGMIVINLLLMMLSAIGIFGDEDANTSVLIIAAAIWTLVLISVMILSFLDRLRREDRIREEERIREKRIREEERIRADERRRIWEEERRYFNNNLPPTTRPTTDKPPILPNTDPTTDQPRSRRRPENTPPPL